MPEDEQEQEQQQPSYPFTQVQVQPQGVLITIHTAPGISMNVAINEDMVNQIMKLWLQTRQDIARVVQNNQKQELALIRSIKQSRND